MTQKILKEILSHYNKEKAEHSERFFKTGKGEYGEGDKFLGINNPTVREFAKKYKELKLNEIRELLENKYHEIRLIGLVILVLQYEKSDNKMKEKIYTFYLKNIERVNNWDLVDLSAPNIIGNFLLDKEKDILYKLANSKNLWKRRISVVSTLTFIKKENYEDCLKICESLLDDKEDLIHKACGWMLREIGKRNVKTLEKFLDKHTKQMPRTMLRYSIERFEDKKRKYYLNL